MGIPPASESYLQVDVKKCAGCGTCMLACSLVHEGLSNPSLARIQVFSDTFGCYPNDVAVFFCRQCRDPKCYAACPLPDQALCIDDQTGVRHIDVRQCNGCQQCVDACPFTPSRIVFQPQENVAVKCDLCRRTPYWNGKGRQACVAACPMKALRLAAAEPDGSVKYHVNLRGSGWASLKFPTD